jgi:hypothetical protein
MGEEYVDGSLLFQPRPGDIGPPQMPPSGGCGSLAGASAGVAAFPGLDQLAPAPAALWAPTAGWNGAASVAQVTQMAQMDPAAQMQWIQTMQLPHGPMFQFQVPAGLVPGGLMPMASVTMPGVQMTTMMIMQPAVAGVQQWVPQLPGAQPMAPQLLAPQPAQVASPASVSAPSTAPLQGSAVASPGLHAPQGSALTSPASPPPPPRNAESDAEPRPAVLEFAPGDHAKTVHPVVTVRQGQSLDSQFVANLEAGSLLVVLEIGEGRRMKVAMQNHEGLVGWVSNRNTNDTQLVVKTAGPPSTARTRPC